MYFMKSCVIIVHEGTEYLSVKLLKFCDIEPVIMIKTGYVCYQEGSVFDDKIKENGIFVLSKISGIIMLKINKF